MNGDVNGLELAIVIALFLLVSVLGFTAARWRKAQSLEHLDEWGLGGRKFGGWITWFLLGGDIYTAYTFVAVPALVFGLGAIGFFTVPYTIIVYPKCLLEPHAPYLAELKDSTSLATSRATLDAPPRVTVFTT